MAIDSERVQILAELELKNKVPEGNRLTQWWGDMNMYEHKPGVTEFDIEKRIREMALKQEKASVVTISVTETLKRNIPVENAASVEEAMDVVQDLYARERIVLDAEDFVDVEYKFESAQGMENVMAQELYADKEIGKRLFVDLDGTCALWQPVAEEQLFEKGYYRNLPEYENVVAAINHIVKENPEVEVFVLSKYFTNSKYALKEKDEWVSEHLPGINKMHRIFVPYEKDKRDLIPGGLRETDFLLDDYTKNLENWQPPARGIKLLNGINHTKGSWQFDRISLMREPKDFAENILNVINEDEHIMDKTPQEQMVENEYDYSKAIEEVLDSSNMEYDIEV